MCRFVLLRFVRKLRIDLGNLRSISSFITDSHSYLITNYKIKTLSDNYVLKYYAHTHPTRRYKKSKSTELYKSKEKLIQQLKFESREDAAPFYCLSVQALSLIKKITKQDEEIGFCKNRLYYIADHIKCKPSVLSAVLATRIFVYRIPPDWLQKSLNVLLGKRSVLEMGVPGERILRDLWVLKYRPELIRERLQKVKDMGSDSLYPWMVRCSENILNRTIEISWKTKEILGDNVSTQEYLAQRLNATMDEVEDMCLKVPYLRTIRVIKVKSFLDFLLSEGFKEEDIKNKPRVLAASQRTITERLKWLRSLGQQSINLNVLCRSRKDFQKYYDNVSKK